jgi:hypothetical protein
MDMKLHTMDILRVLTVVYKLLLAVEAATPVHQVRFREQRAIVLEKSCR